MATFDIRMKPESAKVLSDLAKAGKIDLRPTLNVIGIGYLKEVEQIFAKQQPRGVGDRWPPLSFKYRAWKETHFPGKPILVRTGLLRKSMTIKGALGNIFTISKVGARFGTNVPYGIYHDEGGIFPQRQGRGRLPRRNFSEPSERRRKIWVDQLIAGIAHSFEVNGIKTEIGIS